MNKKAFIVAAVVFACTLSACAKDVRDDVKGNIVLKDGFSIEVPEGWTETDAPMGTVMMAVDTSSVPSDERAREINFQNYFNVSMNSKEGLGDEGLQKVLKDQLVQTMPGVEFFSEKTFQVNTNDAYSFEITVRQNEIDFRILMVMVNGKENDVWMMSFNTVAADWDRDVPVFQSVVDSFLVR
ncbi:MAG: hypothetical protein ABIH78_02645 [Candidatus Peregrinibacteria bacterium]